MKTLLYLENRLSKFFKFNQLELAIKSHNATELNLYRAFVEGGLI